LEINRIKNVSWIIIHSFFVFSNYHFVVTLAMTSPKEWFVVDGQYSKKRIGAVGGGVFGFVIFIWLIVLSAKLNDMGKHEPKPVTGPTIPTNPTEFTSPTNPTDVTGPTTPTITTVPTNSTDFTGPTNSTQSTSATVPTSAKTMPTSGVPTSAENLQTTIMPTTAKTIPTSGVPTSAKNLQTTTMPTTAKTMQTNEVHNSTETMPTSTVSEEIFCTREAEPCEPDDPIYVCCEGLECQYEDSGLEIYYCEKKGNESQIEIQDF